MDLIKLLLNFSLLMALLLAPCMLLMAYWYRRQMPHTLMSWQKPEMVIVTITFSVVALILFIVGISCFFSSWGYLDSVEHARFDQDKFRDIGLVCMLLNISLIFFYISLRILLVRIITDRGIVKNDRLMRVPDYRNIIEWHEISDYYVVSDYPNVIFTLIVQKQQLSFRRSSLRVPVYMKDRFKKLLENRMYSASAMRARSQISPQKFSEN